MVPDTYGHTPIRKAFDLADAYGVGYDEVRASRKPVRLAIIGAGPVVQSKHWPAIKRLKMIWEPVEVTAFALRTEQQARKLQETYGGRWYSDYRDMLEREDVDGVIVASSDTVHAEHTVASLEAGRHVLVEKPITRSLADAARMCRLAGEEDLILMTVSNKRYSPPYRYAKRFVDKGPVSNPALYVGKFNLGYDYIDLFESGTVHVFDLTRFLMGDVSTVRAVGVDKYGRSSRRYPLDNAIATFEFTSGSIGSVYSSASAVSFKPWERVEVYGDHAWLSVEDQYELRLYDSEEGPAKSWAPVFPNTLIFDEEFGGFMGLIENFLQAIRGEEKPIVTGWDGYHAYELCVASQLSISRRGEMIRLPLEPEAADEEYLAWLKSHGWPG